MMEEPNTTINYPIIPAEEYDPFVRVNVMIGMLESSRNANGKLDMGLFHEICTATYLIAHGKIRHGRQISRSLTAKERSSGQNGSSQMILVPLEKGNQRELDMLYEENGRIHIVEAKNVRKSDTSQLKLNVRLAHWIGGAVVYALRENTSQERALKDQYSTIPEAQRLPPIVVFQIPRDEFVQTDPPSPLATYEDCYRRNEVAFKIQEWLDDNPRTWSAYGLFPYGGVLEPQLPTYIPMGQEVSVAEPSAATDPQQLLSEGWTLPAFIGLHLPRCIKGYMKWWKWDVHAQLYQYGTQGEVLRSQKDVPFNVWVYCSSPWEGQKHWALWNGTERIYR